jgi:TPP-dependent pyruvate/acetoin dehydrogenase alpha subunit
MINSLDAAAAHNVAPDVVMDIYRRILRIRRFEEQVGKLFAQGQLPGFVHLYIGAEAVGAGVCAALRNDDYIISTHRGHGHVIAKGGDMQRMMAELFGKVTGYCKGKGGSMHIADFEIGMLGACGIVGGGIPVAVGAGLSASYRGTDQVSVTFFGDGAANEGSFHESLNLASVLKLPVLFVCENNQYGEFTPAERAMNIKDIALRAQGYGIPGVIADGTDPLAMYVAARDAVARARRGEGPTLIEAKTHRKGGHAEGEDAFLAGQQYRSPEEKEAAQRQDPLVKLHTYVVEQGLAAVEELETLDQATLQEVAAALEFARNSPDPGPETLLEDLWV